jgi:hypothetical protein
MSDNGQGRKKLKPKAGNLLEVVVEPDGVDEKGKPRYRVWPAGEQEPKNPPRWSGRLVRKLWGRDV